MNGASLPPLGPLNLEALRVLEGVAGTTRGALDPAAAKLIATLLESGPQGLLFQLADGRRFAAEGSLPYPPGTQLTLKVLPQGEGLVQLQPLQAEPPAPPALLAPLQTEAADLLQRLAAPQPEPGLVALQRLFQALQPPPPPGAEALLETFRAALPQAGPSPQPALSLPQALEAAGFPPEAVEAWQALLAPEPPEEAPARPASPPAAPLPDLPRPTVALLRALGLPERLAPDPERALPTPVPESFLKAKDALTKTPQPLAQRALALLTLLPAATGNARPLPADHPLARLVQALLPELRAAFTEAARAQPGALPPAADPAEPAAWGGWIRGVLETLGRPESSPAQAPAHALQAREGTGLFQIPLPWPDALGPLEVWTEREAAPEGPGEIHRVLIALSLREAGELRIGLQAGPGGVRAQILAEAGKSASLEAALRTELGDPAPFPVTVRALPSLPPRPLALSGGGLQALG